MSEYVISPPHFNVTDARVTWHYNAAGNGYVATFETSGLRAQSLLLPYNVWERIRKEFDQRVAEDRAGEEFEARRRAGVLHEPDPSIGF